GNVFVTGFTASTNFPCSHARQGSNAGHEDVFVTAIDATGSKFLYSTYLGGTNPDFGQAIAVDQVGRAYVTGNTISYDVDWTQENEGFPLKNPIQAKFAESTDAFVSRFEADGALSYSTYLGGPGGDEGRGIAVDDLGNAYITGHTGSADDPTSPQYEG